MRRSVRALALILLALMLFSMMPFALFAEDASDEGASEPEAPSIDTTKPYPEQIADYVASVGGTLWYANDFTGLEQSSGNVASAQGGSLALQLIPKTDKAFVKDGIATVEGILNNSGDPFLNFSIPATQGGTIVIEGSFMMSEAKKPVTNEETGEVTGENIGIPDGFNIIYMSDRTGGASRDGRLITTKDGKYVTAGNNKVLADVKTDDYVNFKVVAVQALNIAYFYVDGEYVTYDLLYTGGMSGVVSVASKNNDKIGFTILRYAHLSGSVASYEMSICVDDMYIYLAEEAYNVDKSPYNEKSYIQTTLLPYLVESGNRLVTGTDFEDDRYASVGNAAMTANPTGNQVNMESGNSIDGKVFYDAYYNILKPETLDYWNATTTTKNAYKNGTQWNLYSNLHNLGHVMPHVKFTLARVKTEENGNHYLAYEQANPIAIDAYMDFFPDGYYTPGSKFVVTGAFKRFENSTAGCSPLMQFRLNNCGNGLAGTEAGGTATANSTNTSTVWVPVLITDGYGKLYVRAYDYTVSADNIVTVTSKNKNVQIGQLFADEFSTVSVAADPRANTMSVYLNGKLVYTGLLMDPTYFNQFTLDGKTYIYNDTSALFNPNSVRMALNQQSNNNATYGGMDIDNLLWYTGDVPVEAANADTTPLEGWQQSENGYWRYYENGIAVVGNKTIGGKNYYFERNNAYASEMEKVALFDLVASYKQLSGDNMANLGANRNLVITDLITGSTGYTFLWTDLYKNADAASGSNAWQTDFSINFIESIGNGKYMKMNSEYAVTKATSTSYLAYRMKANTTYYDLTSFDGVELVAYSNMDINTGWCLLLNADNLSKNSIGYNSSLWTSWDDVEKNKIMANGTSYNSNFGATVKQPNVKITEGWNSFMHTMEGVSAIPGSIGTIGKGRGGTLSAIVSMTVSTSWSDAGYGVANTNELQLYFDAFNFIKFNPVKEIPTTGFKTTDEGTYYYENTYTYATGWKNIDGYDYYFFPYNGLMAKGNVAVDGVGMYFDDEGKLVDSTADGFFAVNGIECIFIDGVMQTGSFEYEGVNYYASSTGKIWSRVGAIGYEYDKAYAPAVYEGRDLNFLVAQNFNNFEAGTFFGSVTDYWNSKAQPYYGSYEGKIKDTTISMAEMVITAKNTYFNVVENTKGDNALEITQIGGLVDSYINVNIGHVKTEVEAGKKYTYQYKMPGDKLIDASQNIVLEYDLKIGADWDNDIGLGQIIGYEGTNGSRTFGPAVARINYQGYVYLGGDKTKVLCKLSTEEYTNIAITFNQTTYTYGVYVNGVCKVDNVSYGKSNGWVITELRAFHCEAAFNNGSLFVDNFYCYIGDAPSLYDENYVVTKPQNGWYEEGGVTRYYEDGFMRMSAIEAEGPDGVVRYYEFDSLNGSLVGTANGFVGGKFYRNGELVANEWVEDENGKYYINADSEALKGAQILDGNAYYFNASTGALEKAGIAESKTVVSVDQILDDNGHFTADYSNLKDGLDYVAKAPNGRNLFAVNCLDPIDMTGYDFLAYDIWLGGDDYKGALLAIAGYSDTFYHLTRVETEVTGEDGSVTTNVTYEIHEDGASVYRDLRFDLEGTWKQEGSSSFTTGGKSFTQLWSLTKPDGDVEYYGRIWSYKSISVSYDNLHAGWNTIYISVSAIGSYAKDATHIQLAGDGWSLAAGDKASYSVSFGDVRLVKLGDLTVKNGWIDGKYYVDSYLPTTGWVDIDGSTYYFDENGDMFTGLKTVGGVLYEFADNGVLVGIVNGKLTVNVGKLVENEKYHKKDWVLYEIERVYIDGYFQVGKTTVDGVTYICDADGAIMKDQTLIVDGYLYAIDADGVATAQVKVWYTDEAGNTYYAGVGGKLTTNASQKIDGYFYAFDENGVMLKNSFFTIGSGKRYFNDEGKAVTGMYEEVIVGYNEDGTPIYKKAYFNATTAMMVVPAAGTDTITADGVTYVCDAEGYIKYEAHDHEYDNACDAECNICGEAREIAGHNYIGVVTEATCVAEGYTTYTCDNCGDSYIADITEITDHTYDNDSDADCNVCGEVREIEELIASGTCGEKAKWKLRADGTLVIYGEGSTEDYLVNITKDQPYRAYASQITKIVVEEGIVSIGRGAFYAFTAVTAVELPDSLIAIHEYAFFGCTKIASMNIPANVFFIDKFALRTKGRVFKTLEFANTEGWTVNGEALDVTDQAAIINKLNLDPTGFNYLCVRGDVTDTGVIVATGTFGNSGEFTWTLSETGVLTVSGTGAMPKFNVNTTPWYGYRGAIRSVVIEEGITSIGRCSFHTCRAIMSASFPESLETFVEYSFYNCPYLNGVTIGENVTRIEIYSFRKCFALKDVEFAYYYGWSVGGTKLSINELYVNPADALTYSYYSKLWTRDVNAEEEVFDPNMAAGGACNTYTKWTLTYTDDTRTSLKLTITGNGIMPNYGTGASPWYEYLDNIVEIEVGEGVTVIGRCAFYGLKFVRTVTLNEGLVTIGEYAFNTCLLLKSISIPSTVETIGTQAFGKSGLTSATFACRTGWTANGTVLATDDMADAATAAEYLKNTYKAYAITRDPATVEEAPSNGWFGGNFYVDGAMVTNTEMYIGVDYYEFDAEGNYEVVENDGDHSANY